MSDTGLGKPEGESRPGTRKPIPLWKTRGWFLSYMKVNWATQSRKISRAAKLTYGQTEYDPEVDATVVAVLVETRKMLLVETRKMLLGWAAAIDHELSDIEGKMDS